MSLEHFDQLRLALIETTERKKLHGEDTLTLTNEDDDPYGLADFLNKINTIHFFLTQSNIEPTEEIQRSLQSLNQSVAKYQTDLNTILNTINHKLDIFLVWYLFMPGVTSAFLCFSPVMAFTNNENLSIHAGVVGYLVLLVVILLLTNTETFQELRREDDIEKLVTIASNHNFERELDNLYNSVLSLPQAQNSSPEPSGRLVDSDLATSDQNPDSSTKISTALNTI